MCGSQGEMFQPGMSLGASFSAYRGLARVVLEGGTTVEALTAGREGFIGVHSQHRQDGATRGFVRSREF